VAEELAELAGPAAAGSEAESEELWLQAASVAAKRIAAKARSSFCAHVVRFITPPSVA
jgi:hypothetical protein